MAPRRTHRRGPAILPLLRPRRLAIGLALGLALLAPGRAARAAQQVLLVSSDSTGPYQAALQALRDDLAGLERDGLVVLARALPELRDGELEASVVAVALGAAAAQRLIASGTRQPIFCVLLPRSAFERIIGDGEPAPGAGGDLRRSAIFLDQPFARQLNLIDAVLPGRSRVLVLTSPSNVAALGPLSTAAVDHGVRLVIEPVPEESDLYAAMTRRLPDADVLLALPDPSVLNPRTVRGVLVTAYHYQVPVIAFSAAYVKAGALASVSSTPAQIGLQAARGVRRVLSGGNLPAPGYPEDFIVDLNDTVARSLDLRLATPDALRRRLLQQEGRP